MDRPLKVAELDHVVLRCRDLDRALDFYTRVLGLAVERRVEQIGLVQLRAGASMLDLVPIPAELSRGSAAGAPETQPERSRGQVNVDHFCLGVDASDLSTVATYLRANSVEVIGEPSQRYGARGMGPSLYIRDPEGNVVELKQLPNR